MNILTKTTITLSALAVLSLTMTGCGGGGTPDAGVMTSAMDKSLDKTFASARNKGNPFDITNMKIVSMEPEKNEGNYKAVIDFTITALDNPAKMAMTMTHGSNIMNLKNLRKGNSHDFKGVQVLLSSTDKGVKILKTR